MEAGIRRWLVPAVAALAVVLVVATVLWTQRPGSSGNDIGPGAGAQPAPPSASDGSSAPGSGPASPDGGLTPVPGPGAPPTAAGMQAVEGYFPRDGTTLALNYATGVPACYGKVGTPTVKETADAVIVSLPKTAPKEGGDVACIDIALMRSVDVTLTRPLGDRVVRDGSRADTQVPRADAPYGNGDEEAPAY